MKLRDARLCLDCDEVHRDGMCPVCGSESFAYVSRWVPAPEGTRAPRPATSTEAEVFRELLSGEKGTNRRLLKRGLLGLTALGLAGWAWRSARAAANQATDGNSPSQS
jgi:predicted RNA-binding protein with PUA domain